MERMEINGSTLPDMLGGAQEQIEVAREALSDVDKKVRAFVKERPGMCLMGAVAAGFIIGRIVSRR